MTTALQLNNNGHDNDYEKLKPNMSLGMENAPARAQASHKV